MTVRGIAFVVTEMLLLFLGLGTTRREIFICFLCVGTVGLFSVLSALFTALTLRIDAGLSADKVIRKEKVNFQMEVRGLALFPTNICINVSIPGERKKSVPCAFQVMPGFKKKIFKCELECNHRGEWNVTIKKLRLYDLFGFFSFPIAHTTLKRNRFALPVSVAPRVIELNKKPRKHLSDSQNGDSRPKASENGETFGDTRQYREGDHMRRIHWVQTARSGETYVRRYEEQASQSALVLLDCSYIEKPEETADIATETALSIINAYVRNDVNTRLICTQNKNTGHAVADILIQDKSSLLHAISALTSVSFQKSRSDIHIRRLRIGKDICAGTLHIVTACPSKELLSEANDLLPYGVHTYLWVPSASKKNEAVKTDIITERTTIRSAKEIREKVGENI